MGAALVLGLYSALGLAEFGDVSGMLDRVGQADVVLLNDPTGTRPIDLVLATRIAVPVEKARQVLVDPASYAKAIPAFRRVEVVGQREGEPGATDLEIAWELDVPVSNLKGRLWLRPREYGVDLELVQGDFAPGLFQLRVTKEKPGNTLLSLQAATNLRSSTWAMRQFAWRSALAEPAITVAASYVLFKAMAIFVERGRFERPTAAMSAPEITSLHDGRTFEAAGLVRQAKGVLAVVRSRDNGRLAHVEVALQVAAPIDKASARRMRPQAFRAFPGWKKVDLVSDQPDECNDLAALCWAVKTNLPFFLLDGTWKIWPRSWRARMVAGDTKDAVMAVDVLPGRSAASAMLVLSQHPRMDRSGFVARKLIAAEPLLEHGLSLALTLVDAVSLGPALERD